MGRRQPTHEELLAELAKAKKTIAALRRGEANAIVKANEDASSRIKDLEAALRASEERLALAQSAARILDNVPGLCSYVNKESRYTFANGCYEQWFGKPPAEIVGKTAQEVLGADAYRLIKDHITAALAGQRVSFEAHVPYALGGIRWVAAEYVPDFDKQGSVEGFFVLVTDITARKQAQDEVSRQRGQLQAFATELSLAEERERRRIAAGLHDNTMQTLGLAKMKLDAQLSKSSVSQRETLEEIGTLLKQAIRDTHALVFELSPPVLYELGFEAALQWICDDVKERYQIMCTCHKLGELLSLREDMQVTLFQVVRELLANVAAHARANHVKIVLRGTSVGNEIVVEDDGIGFDVGDALVQSSGSSGRRRFRRTSFGLYRVVELVESIGGQFEIDSVPGEGTRVTVKVPSTGTKPSKRTGHER